MNCRVREEQLREAMSRHRERVFRLAVSCLKNRQDAEDALQEVFIKYYRFAPEFADGEHEKAWLLRVTINTCRSTLRSPWRRMMDRLSDSLTAPPARDDRLIELVHRLNTRQAAVIHLYYYEDYPVRDIARMMRISEGTVKSRLSRAREQLRAMLEEEEKT